MDLKSEITISEVFELINDYWNKRITKKEFLNKFSFTKEKKIELLKKGFEQAFFQKSEDKIDDLVSIVIFFKLEVEFADILCRLSKEEWHNEHETIASIFQWIHLPRTIDCIYELAISNFEKYRWDDNFALVRKCCFALGDINTPKAKEKLELLLQSDEEMIREHAMEQLKRCDFTNKDVE